MKLTEQLQQLRHTRSARRLMEEYPPDWDMQETFEKTYRQYLHETQGTPLREKQFRRIVQISSFAAVYAAIFAGIFWFTKLPPPDAIREQTVPVTESTQAQTSAEETAQTTTSGENAALPSATQSQTESESDQPQETRPTEENAHSAAVTTVQTDPQETLPAPSVTQDIGETKDTRQTTASEVPQETTETMQEELSVPTSSEDQADEPPPGNAVSPAPVQDGAFTITRGADGQFNTLTYVRSSEEPVTEHEHSFAAEGFTVVSEEIRNAEYDFRTKRITVEDDAGQHYVVDIIGYAYFQTQFSPGFYPDSRSMTVSGRPAYLLAGASADNMALLYWDDGCHISTVISQVKDLDNMIRLAESLTIE